MRLILISVALVGAATGCVVGDPGPDVGEDVASLSPTITPVVDKLAPPDVETFLIESSRPPFWESENQGRQQWREVPAVANDPCACTDDVCLDAWVGSNLGCNVCVVLYCDGQLGPHLCNFCEPGSMDGPAVPQ